MHGNDDGANRGDGVDVDLDGLTSVAGGVGELAQMLQQIQAHVTEMAATKPPLGTSPQAWDLNRKFRDRAATFQERLTTMAIQLNGIHTSVNQTRDAYAESEQGNQEKFRGL